MFFLDFQYGGCRHLGLWKWCIPIFANIKLKNDDFDLRAKFRHDVSKHFGLAFNEIRDGLEFHRKYTVSQKRCHPNHGYNFVSSSSICKILSLPQTVVNSNNTHIGLATINTALCMHVKHVSSVIFYHLSKRYLPNVMKISAKINTMHAEYQHFTFCSFTVLNELKECLIAVRSDFRHDIIDTAINQWRKRLQACILANGGHFLNIFAFFSCVFGSSGFCPSCQIFYSVDAWWSISVPCLTAKL